MKPDCVQIAPARALTSSRARAHTLPPISTTTERARVRRPRLCVQSVTFASKPHRDALAVPTTTTPDRTQPPLTLTRTLNPNSEPEPEPCTRLDHTQPPPCPLPKFGRPSAASRPCHALDGATPPRAPRTRSVFRPRQREGLQPRPSTTGCPLPLAEISAPPRSAAAA